MQPTPPSPGQNRPTAPPHPEINYTAPALGSDNATPGYHPDYNFIMSPGQASRRRLNGLGGSLLGRIAIVLGGLVLLLIVFVIFKNLIGGSSSNTAALINVAQQQQVLIHVSTAATQQQGTSAVTQNSSTTVLASISSAQQQLLSYMKTNGIKVSAKQLPLKISSSQDAQLTASASSGSYDTAYNSVMQTALGSYQQALKQAYAQTKGAKGRALLQSQYDGAGLLLKQLGS